ncbi:MAG: hypothetical protein ACKVT0_12565 [Planctomycetaceae bacterium]
MSESHLDRREFHSRLTKGVAMLGLAASVDVACADEKNAAKKPDDTAKDDPPDEPKEMSPAELIVELTKQQFPHERLTDDFLAALRSHVELNFSYSQTLDNFGLTNADPPGPMMFLPSQAGG